MNPATVARSALLALALSTLAGAPATLAQTAPQPTQSGAAAQPGATVQPGATPPAQRQANPGQANPTRATPPQSNPGGRQANPGQAPAQAAPGQGGRGVGSGRRPRSSYAACNRLAHARGLRGGARRRFLIRCKLGYERPRTPQTAPSRQP